MEKFNLETLGNRELPDPKKEKVEIKEAISDLLFLLGQVSSRVENSSNVDIDMEIDAVKNLLDNEAFWSTLPETKEFNFTLHGQEYAKNFDKQSLKNELAILVEQYDGLQ